MKNLVIVSVLALGLSACATTHRQERDLTGAALGGTAGAVIGGLATHTAGGAVVGGLIGAAGGALIADATRHRHHHHRHCYYSTRLGRTVCR
jgi:uncharacterized protein YcfJ